MRKIKNNMVGVAKLKVVFLCIYLFNFFCASRTFAQQDPLFTQYMFNPLVVNPAYSGSRDLISIALLARNQWTGIEGAPKTQSLSVNSPLRNNKMGAGVILLNDKIGAYQSTGILGSYAYRIAMGPGKLSFGLRAGLYNYKFNWNELEYKNKTDYLNSYSKASKIVPTVDFGIYYYTHKFYSGLSIAHLNNPSFTPNLASNDTITPKSKLVKDIMFNAGKAFVVDEKLTLRPSILVHSSNSVGYVDMNMSFLIRERIWLGMGYRTSKALMFLFEYSAISGFRFGYSFELMQTRLQTVSKASHEVFLGWDLIRTKQKTLSLRYF